MSETEDDVLDRVTVYALLNRLPDEPRLILILVFGLECPADWPWERSRWPPIYSEIGWYVGHKLRGRPISEATVRYIKGNALQELQEMLPNPQKSPDRTKVHGFQVPEST